MRKINTENPKALPTYRMKLGTMCHLFFCTAGVTRESDLMRLQEIHILVTAGKLHWFRMPHFAMTGKPSKVNFILNPYTYIKVFKHALVKLKGLFYFIWSSVLSPFKSTVMKMWHKIG